MMLWAALAAAVVPPLPPNHRSRVAAERLIDGLDAELRASRSATATLSNWCGAHHLAPDPRIRAERDPAANAAPTAEQRARLNIGPDEPVVYRRVRLICGDIVLSEAENWFVSARLTPAMVRTLAETDTPFGTVIAPLMPHRQTVADERLWAPRTRTHRCTPIPAALFRHRALVLDAQGNSLAEVVETYQRGLLAFDVPWAGRAARRCPALPPVISPAP